MGAAACGAGPGLEEGPEEVSLEEGPGAGAEDGPGDGPAVRETGFAIIAPDMSFASDAFRSVADTCSNLRAWAWEVDTKVGGPQRGWDTAIRSKGNMERDRSES